MGARLCTPTIHRRHPTALPTFRKATGRGPCAAIRALFPCRIRVLSITLVNTQSRSACCSRSGMDLSVSPGSARCAEDYPPRAGNLDSPGSRSLWRCLSPTATAPTAVVCPTIRPRGCGLIPLRWRRGVRGEQARSREYASSPVPSPREASVSRIAVSRCRIRGALLGPNNVQGQVTGIQSKNVAYEPAQITAQHRCDCLKRGPAGQCRIRVA